MKILILFSLLLSSCGNHFQTPEIEITTKNNSEREQKVAALLAEVLAEYDLSKWAFTHKVIIEQKAIPHSHPVLTLSTRSTDKIDLMSVYLHEQIHWYVDKYPEAEKNAINTFKAKYKDVPYKNKAGARSEYSTYLHLIVCYLEYQSMIALIGRQKAKQLMWNQTHYTWIYNKVVEEEAYIGQIVQANGFDLLD
ncbi:MAG: hypothetical protein AAF927_24190 [Bacteroidota bacterium]